SDVGVYDLRRCDSVWFSLERKGASLLLSCSPSFSAWLSNIIATRIRSQLRHHRRKRTLLGFIPRRRLQPAAHLHFEASRHFSKFSLTALNVLFRDIFLEL